MKEIVVENSKDRVKIACGSEKQVEVYSDKEVERILFYIQNEDKVSKGNKVIVMLLLYIGVRVSELCRIKIKEKNCRTTLKREFKKFDMKNVINWQTNLRTGIVNPLEG